METPLLYRQLQDQLRQWLQPKDQRHLQGFAEILAAILQSGSAVLGKWLPYLSHRDCDRPCPPGTVELLPPQSAD